MSISSAPKSARRHQPRKTSGRDKRGRFCPGVSGNPNGRPKKLPEIPRDLPEELAMHLSQKIEATGADGRKRRISRFQDLAENLVAEIETVPVKDRLAIIEKLHAMGVFEWMRHLAQPPEPEEKLSDLDRQLLAMAREVWAKDATRRQEDLARRAAAAQRPKSGRNHRRRASKTSPDAKNKPTSRPRSR